jgi:hypothetical protein
VPYKVSPQKGGGFKVTSPNHPQGFSKMPQSKAQAMKQMVAIMVNAKDGGKK